MSINNADHVCINCMREKPDSGVCPFCGFDESQYEPSPHHLPPHSILGGKCLIGRILGEGGFGITYLGWDLNLDLKLAVKEYYPTGYVTRTNTTTTTVTPFRGEKTEFFTSGRSRFIDEAKTLGKFYTLPGIVSVRDFFLENGTAYIVMEYVEGETLKQHLARLGGRMDADAAFALVRPLLRSLSKMHAAGLIHRDISPDNIMITPEGNIKLIDFGAARDYLESGNRSLSVMLKPGLAPPEQYFSRGQQGPWTDIYALSATIYRAVTGVNPPESVERMRSDDLQAPSTLGARISPAQEATLLKGLAVSQDDRWQSIPEFFAALYAIEPAPAARNSVNADPSLPENKMQQENEQQQTRKPLLHSPKKSDSDKNANALSGAWRRMLLPGKLRTALLSVLGVIVVTIFTLSLAVLLPDKGEQAVDERGVSAVSLKTALDKISYPDMPNMDEDELKSMVSTFSKSLVVINQPAAGGGDTDTGVSNRIGFVMSRSGYIITAAAGLQEDAPITAVFFGGDKEFDATLLGIDSETGIAVLKISGVDVTLLSIMAFDTSDEYFLSVQTTGLTAFSPPILQVVKKTTQEFTMQDGDSSYSIAQTKNGESSDSTGNLLIDRNGFVVGFGIPCESINESEDSSGSAAQYWLKAYDIIETAYNLARSSDPSFPVIGIACHLLKDEELQEGGPTYGLCISKIYKDTTADISGMEVGDVILGNSIWKFTTLHNYHTCMLEAKAEDSFTFQVYRNGETFTISGVLGKFCDSVTAK